MISITEAIDEILRFPPNVLTLNEGVGEDKINEFEKSHNLVLPNDYKALLRKTNGLDLIGTSVFGIFDDSVFSSLRGSYKFEHYDVGNVMPMNLIPFSPDGGGNHYCFDSNNCDKESCKIIFWQHNLSYTQDDPPEIVNNSFAEWMKEVLIDWTRENYDYNGNKIT